MPKYMLAESPQNPMGEVGGVTGITLHRHGSGLEGGEAGWAWVSSCHTPGPGTASCVHVLGALFSLVTCCLHFLN